MFAGIVGIASAEIQLLTPLREGGSTAVGDSGKYIKSLYTIGVGLAGILAAVMIVVGGIEYITSGASPSGRADANKRIWAAVGGLLIALLSYIILSTISPSLVKFNIALDGTGGVSGGQVSVGEHPQQKKQAQQITRNPTSPLLYKGIGRKSLKNAGYAIPKDCLPGREGTCVDGMQARLVGELVILRLEVCNKGSVDICTKEDFVLTGGTELRDSKGKMVHVQGDQDTHSSGSKADIRATSKINAYIENNFTKTGERKDGTPLYRNPKTGAVYALETNKDNTQHWDITSYEKLRVVRPPSTLQQEFTTSFLDLITPDYDPNKK